MTNNLSTKPKLSAENSNGTTHSTGKPLEIWKFSNAFRFSILTEMTGEFLYHFSNYACLDPFSRALIFVRFDGEIFFL